MKVIRKGKEKVYTVTCDKCNSDLEYTENDVFYTTEEKIGLACYTVHHIFKEDEQYNNVYMQEYRCVKCPICKHIIKSISHRYGCPSSSKTIRWEKTK